MNNFSVSRRYNSFEDLKSNPPVADVYLTGSDQVWNSIHNRGIDKVFYLAFAPEGKKKCAYAASFGMSEVPQEETEETKNLLQSYNSISVREFSNVDILNKLGILNVQGAVSEHYDITKTAVENMNIEAKVESVRYADEVAKCDGIIISGGESTVIGKIIQRRGIDTVIKENNIPVFGTCAGMVLLAKKTDFDQPLIGLMDIDVERNAFGRQKDSFESMLSFLDEDYLGVFIRAPAVKDYDKSKDNIQVLSELDGKVVAIKQDHNIAIAFHPELTDDTRIHEYFIQEILDCVV